MPVQNVLTLDFHKTTYDVCNITKHYICCIHLILLNGKTSNGKDNHYILSRVWSAGYPLIVTVGTAIAEAVLI